MFLILVIIRKIKGCFYCDYCLESLHFSSKKGAGEEVGKADGLFPFQCETMAAFL